MRFPLLLIPLLLGFVPALSATVLVPAEFREIVSGSQIIVYGRVSDIRPEWIDGRRRIESVITRRRILVLSRNAVEQCDVPSAWRTDRPL